jgi:anthranilate phosphoribosyltransferase
MERKRIEKPQYSLEELKELASGFNINQVLKHHAYQNKPVDFTTAYLLGVYAIFPYRSELNDVFRQEKITAEKQSIAALCALHNRETYRKPKVSEQIAGILAAVFDYDIGLSEYGFLLPAVKFAMDNCGMGGDLFRTPNVSTISALIAAADGIPMAKHGSPGNTDSTGSSDFLGYMGVNLFADKRMVEKALKKFHFGYTDALDTRYKVIHTQTHNSAHLAHMNDLIGPVTNPLHPKLMKARVLGVNHLIKPEVVADAYLILNKRGITSLKHGLFVRGFVTKERDGGIDEVSTFQGGTIIAELKGNKIETYELHADDFGLKTGIYKEPPRGKKEKAEFGKQILQGKVNNFAKDLILANTAILEYLAYGISLKDGVDKARNVLESRRPLKNLQEYCKFVK